MFQDFKKIRGQFFTSNKALQGSLVSLLTPRDRWDILEPSAGMGDLTRAVRKEYPNANVISWELDALVADKSTTKIVDFFLEAAKTSQKFDSIIGNPPFVVWKNVEPEVKLSASSVKSRYNDKANLYYLFVDRCIDLLKDGGELVFVQPKEWLYSAGAFPLREKILKTGGITHFIDLGESRFFQDASIPALMIFRYQKGLKQGRVLRKGNGLDSNWGDASLTQTSEGLWVILPDEEKSFLHLPKVGDFFDVKVGLVTGADAVFNVTGRKDLETFKEENSVSAIQTTRGREWFLDLGKWSSLKEIPEFTRGFILEHEETLRGRKIRSFNDDNWWHYGAVRNRFAMENQGVRIYCRSKTRDPQPFFLSDTKLFGGWLLGMFPRFDFDLDQALTSLNSVDFRKICEAYGMTTGNKVTFQPSTLMSLPFFLYSDKCCLGIEQASFPQVDRKLKEKGELDDS